jgi:tetratricopeptide (TPR) repeat protein
MMLRSLLMRSVVCALALALQLTAASVSAQDLEDATEPESATDRARIHFHNGVDFYHEGNFRAALIEFKRAYKASPHYKLLYNLGQVSLELQEDGSAIDYFTHYLREGGDELSPERKLEVQQNLVRLKARLAHATITADQAGAEIYVDDGLAGISPLSAPVRLSVGRHHITAKQRGVITAQRTLDVAAGDNLVVALELESQIRELSQPLAMSTAAEEGGGLSPAAWGGIATAVIGAGAITLTVLTALAQANYDRERNRQTSETKLNDLRDGAKLRALGADIAWGLTIGAAGITSVLLLTSGGSERAPTDDKRGVKINLGAGSLQLRGRF